MSLTHTYIPKTTKDVVGQDDALKALKKGVHEYSSKKIKKALLIYGPTGTGKTSSIIALAKELDLELIEVNASDSRNTEGLEQKVLPAIKQQSLFSKGKIILIDEIDGISGTSDRGGLLAISKFIEQSPYPIILTANDPWDQKFSPLRKQCIMIEYKAVSILETIAFLKKIALQEKTIVDEDAVSHLARISKGDLRAALNDFQNAMSGKKQLSKEDVLETGDREREETIANALLKVLKTTNPDIALGAYEHIDEDIDQIFLWLDENIPKEYLKPQDLAAAYENLSLADVYFGRIRRWQYYRYYVYIYNLLSAGIALSKKERYTHAVEYKQSGRILQIWIANQKKLRRKAIAKKVAIKTHTSTKRAFHDVLYLRAIYKRSKDKKYLDRMTEELKLEKEEIEWLKK
ncbi:MAG: replication factor C large subunit [Candidatus Woesearchaeota archaeon]